jgi:hypothetical protein
MLDTDPPCATRNGVRFAKVTPEGNTQQGQGLHRPSIEELLARAPWTRLEEHLDGLRERVDESVTAARTLRNTYREELLRRSPEVVERIRQPTDEALDAAERLLLSGTVAAADGTVSAVPLLGGSKIQVGVVIVFNSGEVVDLVTRIFEVELSSGATSASEFFSRLRKARTFSNLLSRAVMLFGERKLLMEQDADWRLIHGELIPHELRTGAGHPTQNLPPAFELIHRYIQSETFIAVSESPEDLDILNAAILLEPGEYIEIRKLTDTLKSFLEGDPEIGQSRANFAAADERRFRQFIESAGPQVSVVLAKAGQRPFLLECHERHVDEAVALFLADSLWTRGFSSEAGRLAIRGFPFHLDLADQVARTLFKGSEFRDFVESRVMTLGVEEGIFDLDPRRTRT